ncbi:hypothetical protein [uncultured Deinococcus sp.]|uniref:hypothetical protein n=1 Tax=uncultured Deinococcus sp. TaxID=158789 RepID=UPI0025880891|nr:hypothetical protein [uncultured Deinococcus sp.]
MWRRAAPWPTSGLLFLLTLGGWAAMLAGPGGGVQVANHSGAVLRGAVVCAQSCVVLPPLWPTQTWHGPLDEGTRRVVLKVSGQSAAADAEAGLHFVVGRGGRVVAE